MSSASSTLSQTASATSAAPSSTSSGSSGGGGSSGAGKNFLFFVALGFGVVFTNLWIIVGVKYCFRYNQRARQGLTGDDNAAIDMGAVPPRRRKREKKLMTMDEVNDRFPLTKYKVWRSNREQEGLPATGGITAPPSRAGSVKGIDRFSVEGEDTEPDTPAADLPPVSAEPAHPDSDTRDFATNPPEKENVVSVGVQEMGDGHSSTPNATPLKVSFPTSEPVSDLNSEHVSDPVSDPKSDEDDDPIQGALPDTVLETTQPGDSCAICIDSLDEEDEVRGLTCGHAFHASCIDPWLTSRRACCPLCKTDYYTPKPAPEGAIPNATPATTPSAPLPVLHRSRFFTGFNPAPPADRQQGHTNLIGFGFASPLRGQPHTQARRSRRAGRESSLTTTTGSAEAAGSATGDRAETRFPSLFSTPRSWGLGRGLNRSARTQNSSEETATPTNEPSSTPRQLEAGVR